MLGALVFAAAATLTQTTVAKSVFDRPADKPYDQVATAGDVQVRLQIDPNRTGLNTYAVAVTKGGAPVAAERVRLTFRYLDDQSIGPSTLRLGPGEGGSFLGQGPFLTLEGQWRVEVELPDHSGLRRSRRVEYSPCGGGDAIALALATSVGALPAESTDARPARAA